MKHTIIPQHTAYPRTFTAQICYELAEKWTRNADESDTALNDQLKNFVDTTGCQITYISPPNVNVYEETPVKRIYITSVSILYLAAAEGTDDDEQKDKRVGDVPGNAEPAGPQDAATGDS